MPMEGREQGPGAICGGGGGDDAGAVGNFGCLRGLCWGFRGQFQVLSRRLPALGGFGAFAFVFSKSSSPIMMMAR
jgi:hypothetical protein